MRLVLLGIFLLVASPALAREPEPQLHEVSVDVDIAIETQENASLFDAQYTFTPSGTIDRIDVVHPLLRRYVREPSAIWLHVHRFGSSNADSQSSAQAGGILYLADGLLYGRGDVGLEIDRVNLANEDGYYTLPFHLEVGARPVRLLSLGAYYDSHPVISATSNEVSNLHALRSGSDAVLGGSIAYASPNDRVFVALSGEARLADWTFAGFHAGDTTIRGAGAHLRLAFQATPTLSLQLRLDGGRDHWVDGRAGDDDVNWVGSKTDRIVYTAAAAIDLIYWYKGRLGFRFSLGGGYSGAPPILGALARGGGKFGFGFVSRF